MSYHSTDGEAFHALHLNRISKRHDGWGVYDLGAGNCAVIINTGQLGTGTGTLTVQPGDALLNGTDAVITEQIVNIPQADTAPRKDAVVLYPDGTVGREAGTPEPKQPTSRELTRSERPAPPDLSTVNCVPLAIVNVPAGATAITAAEIIDVRPPAFVGGGGTTAASISGRYPETGTITADGTTSSFSWTIQSPATLSMALATAVTSDASTDFSVTTNDATNTITVSYSTAPVGELAWYWAANVSITDVETVTHGAASHDPSVADQADLDAHTTNTSNPHATSLEKARVQNNLLEGKVRNALSENDFLQLNDGSGGTNTAPYTLRFDDKDFRLWAGGVGGIGSAVHVGHDSGDVTFGGGFTAQGSGHITGDLAVDGNIAGTVDQADLATKADKDGGGTGTLSNYASVETDAVNVSSANGTNDNIRVEPDVDALRNGYLVGHAPGYSIVVDPREFATDAAAIQHANDTLFANLGSGVGYGFLYIPVKRPDGTPYTIGSTVTIGDRSKYKTIVPRGWGFGGNRGDALNITINDGSPAFHLVGDPNGQPAQLNCTWFGGFSGDASGNDAEFFRLSDVTGFHMTDIQAREFGGGLASGAFVFDGACWNSWINRVNFNGGDATIPNANAFAIEDATLNGPPGELYFGPGISTYADPARPFNDGLHVTSNSSNIMWGGRIEGAGGNAAIYQTGGHLYLTSYSELGRLENLADNVHFTGYSIAAAPGVSMYASNPRHGYYVDATRGVIHPPNNSGMTGDTIHIVSQAAPSHRLQVPYENTVNGTVNYPLELWANLVYPDGWQRWRTGTTTITGAATTQLEAFAGHRGDEMRVTNLSISGTPTGDPRYQIVRGYNTTQNRHWVGVEETAGVTFDLNWEVQVQR